MQLRNVLKSLTQTPARDFPLGKSLQVIATAAQI